MAAAEMGHSGRLGGHQQTKREFKVIDKLTGFSLRQIPRLQNQQWLSSGAGFTKMSWARNTFPRVQVFSVK